MDNSVHGWRRDSAIVAIGTAIGISAMLVLLAGISIVPPRHCEACGGGVLDVGCDGNESHHYCEFHRKKFLKCLKKEDMSPKSNDWWPTNAVTL
jgi:hypothetical protein